MRYALCNIHYSSSSTVGGNAHVFNFIEQATDLGVELWGWPTTQHAKVRQFSGGKMQRIRQMRQVDCYYHRVERHVPASVRWAKGWRRKLVGSKPHIWEFNTVPEFGEVQGLGPSKIAEAIEEFKRNACYCDLAICVSSRIADYVTERLGIRRVAVVPNGSDPDRFSPSIPTVSRLEAFKDKINVVWIGSAGLAWHDFSTIAGAAKAIHASGRDDIAFHIIGKGLRDIEDIPPNVHYHGSVSYERLPAWLSGMDIGLCAYRDGAGMFSSPLKVFDYMASGLAVVSTYQPQVEEILSAIDRTKYMVAAADHLALADRIKDLVRCHDDLLEFQRQSRELLMARYTWRMNAEEVLRQVDLVAKNGLEKL